MKKLIMVIFSLCMLITISGCQTSGEAVTSNEFVKQFITNFLSFKYQEHETQQMSQAKLSEKIGSYFNETGYSEFTKYNYIAIPTKIGEHYKSNVSVTNIRLEETYNEVSSVGYIADIELESSLDIIELKLRIRIKNENNNWKIYSIRFINIDELIS